MPELLPSSSLSDEELAELFAASFDGYVVPFTMDVPTLRFYTDTFDLVRDASFVAVRDGERVGLVNVGLRGHEAWIGGMGVVPDERRRGTGRALMEAAHAEARRRGVGRVWLEVIVENEGAVALYHSLGYERVRDLEVWTLAGGDGEPGLADAAAAHEWIRAHRAAREPWQRDDASLAKLTETQGLRIDGAAAVVRVSGGRVNVLQLAGRTDRLHELLAGARGLGEAVSVLNLPSGDPASVAFEALGGTVAVRQHEMVLRL